MLNSHNVYSEGWGSGDVRRFRRYALYELWIYSVCLAAASKRLPLWGSLNVSGNIYLGTHTFSVHHWEEP